MKSLKMAAIIVLILLPFTLGGCVNTDIPFRTGTTTPRPTIAASPADNATETRPVYEPDNASPKPFTGDLPAYLEAGLPTRDKMTEIERWYYYDEEMPGTDTDSETTRTMCILRTKRKPTWTGTGKRRP